MDNDASTSLVARLLQLLHHVDRAHLAGVFICACIQALIVGGLHPGHLLLILGPPAAAMMVSGADNTPALLRRLARWFLALIWIGTAIAPWYSPIPNLKATPG